MHEVTKLRWPLETIWFSTLLGLTMIIQITLTMTLGHTEMVQMLRISLHIPSARDAPKLVITESCKSRRNIGSLFITVTPLASEATARILN